MTGQSNRTPARALIADSPAIEELVTRVCQELRDHFPEALVREMIHDVASGYRDAKITVYVPIFVCRKAKERLARMALLSDAREGKQGGIEANTLYGVVTSDSAQGYALRSRSGYRLW